MDYTPNLTEEEKIQLCKLATGKFFKVYYQNFPKEFSKIKPGFRANTLRESDALDIALKNIGKTFITRGINLVTSHWMDEISEEISSLMKDGLEKDYATAQTLLDSVFDTDINLYFKLIHVSNPDYIQNISNLMRKIAVERSASVQEEKIDQVVEQENNPLLDQIAALSDQVRDGEHKLAEAKKEHEDREDKLKERISELESALEKEITESQKCRSELKDFQRRAEFEDTMDPSQFFSDDYQHVSFCEVAPPDYNGIVFLERLADISASGTLEAFQSDEYRPKMFDNRERIFFKDGPSAAGSVGVWSWSAIPNNSDSSKDYITSEYVQNVTPIEVIYIDGCVEEVNLLQALKDGIPAQYYSENTAMYAVYLGKRNNLGLLCHRGDFEISGDKYKLKSEVISLAEYTFNSSEILKLDNGKFYFRRLSIGIPSSIVQVKDSLEVIKGIIISKSSWQLLKQAGKTRNEWKQIKDFLEKMDIYSIEGEIADKLHCSVESAAEKLNEFLGYANRYIDGSSFEDSLLESIISVNDDLMERCKSLIRNEWEEENRETISSINTEIDNLHAQCKEASEQLEKAQRDKATEEAELQGIETQISNKKKLAEEVERAVADRIEKAQSNAAEFIAQMAFQPKQNIDVSYSAGTSVDTSDSVYVEGALLQEDMVDIMEDWKDVFETLTDELIEAGVAADYARPLAAYLYSAYLSKTSLLLIGPSANAIIDAFSYVVTGKKSAVLQCGGTGQIGHIFEMLKSKEEVIRVENPFDKDWISQIPRLISETNNFYLATYPFAEDVMIEPKSVFTYMVPILTDPLIEKSSTGNYVGGKKAENFTEYVWNSNVRKTQKIYTTMHMTTLLKNKITMLLCNMHNMLGDKELDYDFILAVLPYAYVTLQMSLLFEKIHDESEKDITVSGNLIKLITELYGEFDGEVQ